MESTWLGYYEPYTIKRIVSFVGQMMLNNRQAEIAEENGLLPFELLRHKLRDLILKGPRKQVWAIEIKKSAAPVLSKGFHTACEDIQATHKKLVV